MNYAKIKRAISTVIAAALCFAVSLSVPAAAKNDDDVWRETKAMAGVKYNSAYIKWLGKYSEKETKSTVAYSKSRAKKFVNKVVKAANADDPQFVLDIAGGDYIVSGAVKGDKFRAVGFIDGEGMAYYCSPENMTFFDINAKEKCAVSADEAYENDFWITDPNDFAETVLTENIFSFYIPDDEKGKLFKIKSGEKTYYCEIFGNERNRVGFLFSEKGNILAVANEFGSFCVSFSKNADDSLFDVPEKDFKNVKYEDIEWLN